MKKKKYITREVMVQRLFRLALEINSLECRQRRICDTPAVLFDFSGHVSEIHIRIFLHGWESGTHADKNYEMYLDKKTFSVKKYKQIYKELEDIRDGLL